MLILDLPTPAGFAVETEDGPILREPFQLPRRPNDRRISADFDSRHRAEHDPLPLKSRNTRMDHRRLKRIRPACIMGSWCNGSTPDF